MTFHSQGSPRRLVGGERWSLQVAARWHLRGVLQAQIPAHNTQNTTRTSHPSGHLWLPWARGCVRRWHQKRYLGRGRGKECCPCPCQVLDPLGRLPHHSVIPPEEREQRFPPGRAVPRFPRSAACLERLCWKSNVS